MLFYVLKDKPGGRSSVVAVLR